MVNGIVREFELENYHCVEVGALKHSKRGINTPICLCTVETSGLHFLLRDDGYYRDDDIQNCSLNPRMVSYWQA